MSAEIVPFNLHASPLPWQAAPVADIIALFPQAMPDRAFDREAGGRVVELLRQHCDLAMHFETYRDLNAPAMDTPAVQARVPSAFLRDLAESVIRPLFETLDAQNNPLAYYLRNMGTYLNSCAAIIDEALDQNRVYTARAVATSGYQAAFPPAPDNAAVFSV